MNCAGLTNSVTTTTSQLARARRMSDRWPSCSAPIVGTSPMTRPARRGPSSCSRSSRDRAHDPHAAVGRRWRRGCRCWCRRRCWCWRAGQAPRRVRERVEQREVVRRALGDGGPLAAHRVLVAARDRPGQGLRGAAGRPVVDARAHERDERLALDAGAAGDALGEALERHEEVRRDRRGRVVGGAVLVGDVDGPHPERLRERRRGRQHPRRRAGNRRRGAVERRAVRGDGHQRMQRERLVAGERRERRRGRQVSDEQAGPVAGQRGRRGRDLGVGDGEQDGVDVLRQRRAAAERAGDVDPGGVERGRERRAHAPSADDGHAVRRHRGGGQHRVLMGVHIGPVLVEVPVAVCRSPSLVSDDPETIADAARGPSVVSRTDRLAHRRPLGPRCAPASTHAPVSLPTARSCAGGSRRMLTANSAGFVRLDIGAAERAGVWAPRRAQTSSPSPRVGPRGALRSGSCYRAQSAARSSRRSSSKRAAARAARSSRARARRSSSGPATPTPT